MKKYKLNIGWLYPDLMNIYGDRGNIIVLQKRCEWRGIKTEIISIDQNTNNEQLLNCDLLMMGGAQDTQQEIVGKDLEKKKQTLKKMIEDYVPGLYICGGFQYLGKYYKEASGNIINQLGILDMYTENPGDRRLIGNIAIEVDFVIANEVKQSKWVEKRKGPHGLRPQDDDDCILVGFENHGGRTILGSNIKPLGKVIYGYGSNDVSLEEGAIYKNTIGTYFHGPILPKNPELADWLIARALEKKYGSTSSSESKEKIELKILNDSIAKKAREVILKKLIKNY